MLDVQRAPRGAILQQVPDLLAHSHLQHLICLTWQGLLCARQAGVMLPGPRVKSLAHERATCS